MNIKQSTSQNKPISLLFRLTRLWDGLTTPSSKIQEPEQQQVARLLSSLLLALMLIVVTILPLRILSSPATPLSLLPIIIAVPLALYWLSRTNYYRLAGVFVVVFFPTETIIVSALGLVPSTGFFFAYVGILLSSVIFSRRVTAIVASLTILAIALVPQILPGGGYGFNELIVPIGFITVASSLQLIIQRYQQQLEQDRQADLQQSEIRYRTLYHQTPVMMHSLDIEGRLISVNDFWLDNLGYKQNEVLGHPFLEFLTKASRHDNLKEVLPEFWQKDVTRDAPYQVVKKNGECIDVLLTGIVQRDKAGQPHHSLVFLIDVSERKRIDRERGQYIERLQILREIDQAILSVQSTKEVAEATLEGIKQLIPCRRAVMTIFDLTENTAYILGVLTDDKTGLDQGQRFPFDPYWSDWLERGKIVHFDDIQTLPDSSAQMIKLKAAGFRSILRVPLLIPNGPQGAISLLTDQPAAFDDTHLAIIHDITAPLTIALQQAQLHEQIQQHSKELEGRVEARTRELKERMAEVESMNQSMGELLQETQSANQQLEMATTQLKATNAELESFAYAVSHDLRAPLRAVTGFSYALEEDYDDRLDDEGKGLLKRIQNAGQRMGQLIDDLLELSRITRQGMQPASVNLSLLVEQIMIQYCLDEPEREVTYTVAPEVIVNGDERLLLIVLENLLSNAWKYTSKVAKAHIEFGTTKQDNETACFVRDNGVGFDMAYAHKLYGPFQRLHRIEEFEGTGIGLATVQRIIHRHGGQVWAEAELGKGAMFYFSL